jgi:hypothetical protein
MKEEMKEGAGRVAEKARDAGSRLAGRAREQANRLVDERRDRAATSLDSLSGVLRDNAGRLRGEQSFFGDYAETAAERVDRLARYLREGDPEKFYADVEDYARRRPEIFMGGMFVTGLLLARFLKSSSDTAADNDFVYAGGGGGGFSGRGYATGTSAGTDAAFQPESGAYGGQPPAQPGGNRPITNTPGTTRGASIAPDDESGLGF